MAKPGNIQSSSRARRHGAVSTEQWKERRSGQLEGFERVGKEWSLRSFKRIKEYKGRERAQKELVMKVLRWIKHANDAIDERSFFFFFPHFFILCQVYLQM
jgi:hypothetical protein